jgi:molecular chaperone DnaK
MVQEAEAHKAEDEARKALVELKNKADALIHQTKKTLAELGEKVVATTKEAIEKLIAELEALIKDDNATKEQIEAKINELNAKNQELAQQAAAANSGADAEQGSSAKPEDDDVIDAEVE